MIPLKRGEGVPLLNFKECPDVSLLNFEGGPGVTVLTFSGVPGPILNFDRGPRSQGPKVSGPGVLVLLLHHTCLYFMRYLLPRL